MSAPVPDNSDASTNNESLPSSAKGSDSEEAYAGNDSGSDVPTYRQPDPPATRRSLRTEALKSVNYSHKHHPQDYALPGFQHKAEQRRRTAARSIVNQSTSQTPKQRKRKAIVVDDSAGEHSDDGEEERSSPRPKKFRYIREGRPRMADDADEESNDESTDGVDAIAEETNRGLHIPPQGASGTNGGKTPTSSGRARATTMANTALDFMDDGAETSDSREDPSDDLRRLGTSMSSSQRRETRLGRAEPYDIHADASDDGFTLMEDQRQELVSANRVSQDVTTDAARDKTGTNSAHHLQPAKSGSAPNGEAFEQSQQGQSTSGLHKAPQDTKDPVSEFEEQFAATETRTTRTSCQKNLQPGPSALSISSREWSDQHGQPSQALDNIPSLESDNMPPTDGPDPEHESSSEPKFPGQTQLRHAHGGMSATPPDRITGEARADGCPTPIVSFDGKAYDLMPDKTVQRHRSNSQHMDTTRRLDLTPARSQRSKPTAEAPSSPKSGFSAITKDAANELLQTMERSSQRG